MLLSMLAAAFGAPFVDVTEETIGTTGEWSNRVEVADLDRNGWVDIVFANGGDYASPGDDQLNRVFLNHDGVFTEATESLLGSQGDLARAVKACDVTGDGWPDLVVATTYQSQPRLFHNDGAGGFVEQTAALLPTAAQSWGDVECGDVDADGDLDLVAVDWGPGNPLNNQGGRVVLWRNDEGTFVDASEPFIQTVIGFSWDLELNDVDNDFDLDVLVASKTGNTSFLFRNDGDGSFVDNTAQSLPAFSNNYDFEAFDVDRDGDLDLATVNDGRRLTEHLLLNDGRGGFAEAPSHWPADAQVPGSDDNALAWLDIDSDGDSDLLVGSLSAADRLLLNDGTGVLALAGSAFEGAATPGTLGLALADLDGDGRLDAVQAQGETASPDHVFFGEDIAPDTAPPHIGPLGVPYSSDDGQLLVRVRIHDGLTPVRPDQFAEVWMEVSNESWPLEWAGGQLWQARAPTAGTFSVEVCARDAADNAACEGPFDVVVGGGVAEPLMPSSRGSASSGCGCSTSGLSASLWVVLLTLSIVACRRAEPTPEEGIAGLDTRPASSTCIAWSRPDLGAEATLEPAFPNLQFNQLITAVQAPGDPDHWFVATQRGRILRFVNDPDTEESELLVNLNVSFGGEMGLLSMAFHPDFAQNGELYVYGSWPSSAPGVDHVSRILKLTSPDQGATFDADAAELVLEIDQPYANHNGGTLAFGPDGHLYLGTGDGGDGGDPDGNGQSLDTLLGKILRIDVDGGDPYAIPEDNPFASGGGRAEIYAWGMRNPFRMSFDPYNGDLWVGDVGQNRFEEISRVSSGQNHGWNIMEGFRCFRAPQCDQTNLALPVVAYGGAGGVRSVVVGEVYRGTAIPELDGVVLYSDYFDGEILGIVVDPISGEPSSRTVVAPTGRALVHYTRGADGEVYVADQNQGTLHKLVPQSNEAPANQPPERLTDTGCVDPAAPRNPAPGLIPYDLNHPFWSDGADKRRWLALPEDGHIEVGPTGDWTLPVGTVLVKQFERSGQLLETRLLMRHEDGGWGGYSYVWNAEGTEATLALSGAELSTPEGPWEVPSTGACITCHTPAAGGSLGLETGQLAREITYPSTGRTADQLLTLDAIGAFDPPLGLTSADVEPFVSLDAADVAEGPRVRDYLHVNCSMCHRDGPNGRAEVDLRRTVELAQTGLCDPPKVADLGINDALLVAPGAPERSILLSRLATRTDAAMPPLGSRQVDDAAVTVFQDWIATLTECDL